jgi:hypothetical protein
MLHDPQLRLSPLSTFKTTSFKPNALFNLSNPTIGTTDILVNIYSDNKLVVIYRLESCKSMTLKTLCSNCYYWKIL